MKRAILWIVVLIVVVGVIAAIANNNKKPAAVETGPIKVGFIGPLSGGGAPYGDATKGGVQFAVDKLNANGGIHGRQIQVIYEDGKCNGKDAATAASKLVNIDNVKYIIGMPCSGEVLSVAPISEPKKVVLLVQGSSPDITNAGKYIFRVFPSDLISSQTVADHAIAKGKKTAAAIVENTEYSVALDKAFEPYYEKLGGKITDSETYDSNTTDFRSILSKIKTSNPQMLLIDAQVGSNAARIAKQARDLGIQAQFYTLYFSGDDFVKSSDAVNGTYIVDVPILNATDPKTQGFITDYKKGYSSDPAYLFFTGGSYDETNILAQALAQVGDDTDAVSQYLYKLPSYTGTIGTYHFDQNGDVVGVPLRMLQVVNGKTVVSQ